MSNISKEQYSWQYQVTWQLKDELSENQKEIIEQLFLEVSEENAECFYQIDLNNKIRLIITSKLQININKMMRTLLKKAAKTEASFLAESSYLSLSQSEEPAQEDVRLNKIIGDIREGTYYDLEEDLTEEELTNLKHYLRERTLGTIEYEGQLFIIDQSALNKKINLNCFECTKRYDYGCCCGSPCGFSDKNMSLFDRYTLQMEETIKEIDAKQYETIISNGGFMTANGKLREFNGHCSLLVAHEGDYKCLAHKYALDHQIPIYELCPLSCLMYPLEVIELITEKRKKIKFITSVVDPKVAREFGRWGSYESLETPLRCINEKEHNEFFAKEDYQPVYQVNEGLLIHEFGEIVYHGIGTLMSRDK